MKSAVEKIKSRGGVGGARIGEVTVLNKVIRNGLTKIRWLLSEYFQEIRQPVNAEHVDVLTSKGGIFHVEEK